jgi:flagellar biosynthetic protein FliR
VLDLLKALINLPLFLLVACRMSGIVLAAPLFSSLSIPVRLKVAFVVLSSLVFVPFAIANAGEMPTGVYGFAPIFVSELGMGLVIGFVGAMVLGAIEMAGSLISQQIGLSLANIADPATGQSTAAVSVFLSMLALLLLLSVDGHHWFVTAVGVSYRHVPLGTVSWRPALLEMYTAGFSGMFNFMLRVAAPMVGLMFLVNIMMALIAKAAPGIHILIVGYPVKMLAGIIFLAATFPLLWPVIRTAFTALRLQLWRTVNAF